MASVTKHLSRWLYLGSYGRGGALGYRPGFLFFTEGVTVKITMFNDRPVRHVQYMRDGTVILKLYERRPGGQTSRSSRTLRRF